MPSPAIVAAHVRALLAKQGVNATARQLGLDPDTVARVAAGYGVRPGSVALAAIGLGLLVPAPAALCTTPSPTT
jgi:hypothetical protein